MSIIPPIFYLLEERHRHFPKRGRIKKDLCKDAPDPNGLIILGFLGALQNGGRTAEPRKRIFKRGHAYSPAVSLLCPPMQ